MHHRPTTPARARALALIVPLLASAALSGCSSPADAGGPASATRTFEADNGTVEIPVDPQRIVATGYAVPVLIEADANLVGISTWQRGLAKGTNIGTDIGIDYSGEVAEATGGSGDVSEYPAIEQLPEVFGGYDVLTHTIEADGSVAPGVQYVLDNPLWQSLPAVQAGNVVGVRYTEAATYESALRTLDALDAALEPLLDR